MVPASPRQSDKQAKEQRRKANREVGGGLILKGQVWAKGFLPGRSPRVLECVVRLQGEKETTGGKGQQREAYEASATSEGRSIGGLDSNSHV